MLNSQEAFDFVNSLFIEETKASLNQCEKDVFTGIWENKTYKQISEEIFRAEQSIRETGANLCQKITEVLRIEVNKRNFKPAIEQVWRERSPEVFTQEEVVEKQVKAEATEALSIKCDSVRVENIVENPFIPQTGKVDDPKLFFGRKAEMHRVFEILNSNSSVALIGEEGIGKSSLLSAICRQAESHLLSPRQPIYLDLNNIYNEDDFYIALCGEIGIPESKGYRLTRNLRDRRVLLAIDNVAKLTGQGFTRQVRDQLRGLAEGSHSPLRLILAANEPLDDLFDDSQDEGKTSPLVGICQEENIKPWDETTISDFIKYRLSLTSVYFTEEEMTQLAQESGGHPRRLMQLCYQTYARYMEGVQ